MFRNFPLLLEIRGLSYLLEDKVGITTTYTLDGGDGEHDVPLTINVGVHNTQNVLKRTGNNQRHVGPEMFGRCSKHKYNLKAFTLASTLD